MATLSEHRKRWTPHRKAELIAAVRAEKLTAEEAQTLHEITPEEFAQWSRDFDVGGRAGLSVRDQSIRNRRRAERLAGAPLGDAA